ncbi:L,D-transpeptidase family protein [Novosphingobium mangrovi (ex Hu et al. 2023)]|uniref:L,D-transpeptidase family protein n=1 Tax=Novosphingobium mangrovi (ex Hu et al. 2023) TaxID=2930094 RepID=A0ABT0AHF8_9SPHN|nr:L,D-transpeptidase family protein [Novosphingobium mangrovi (ex Hu et al. 2023)]MCJ1962641.1 L,D-transpeptidase family protein [Novosphingobium mangrovi (ex Hu et al. 2023)]
MSSRLLLLSGLGAIVVIGGVLTLAGRSDPAPEATPSPVEVARAEPAPAPAAPSLPAPDEPFVIKRILPIEGPIRYGEWHWDEDGVPDGPLVITVDLDARVLSVFRGGYEIGATAVLLGSQEKPTPTGVFPITEKDIDHVSNIYTGAPMPYMQRLTNDGVSLHGSKVEKGYASHGCVGMPDPFAAKLFQMTKLGDKVYITRGKQIGMGDSLVEG